MIRKLLIIAMVAGLALTGVAANNTNTTTLYNANELSAQVAFNYSDVQSSKFSPVLGVTYYVTRNLGLAGSTTVNVENGTAFNNADLLVVGRLPVLKVLSPYVGVGARYDSTRNDKWSPLLVGGTEFRLNKSWGAFAQVDHDFQNGTKNLGEWGVKVGLNLRFW